MSTKEKLIVYGVTLLLISLIGITTGLLILNIPEPMEYKGITSKNSEIQGLYNTLQTLQTQAITQKRELQNLAGSIKIHVYIMEKTGLGLEAATTMIQESRDRGIPIQIFLGLFDYESDFNVRAKNPESTARGLGQFLDSTARWVAQERGVPYTYDMLDDPVYSIRHTAWYLEYLYKRHGSWPKALHGYGDQTESYSRIVISRSEIYRKELSKINKEE